MLGDIKEEFGSKVQLLWEGHKNVRNGPYGFEIYLVNVKTMRKIAQIFVALAFSEKLNRLSWKLFKALGSGLFELFWVVICPHKFFCLQNSKDWYLRLVGR